MGTEISLSKEPSGQLGVVVMTRSVALCFTVGQACFLAAPGLGGSLSTVLFWGGFSLVSDQLAFGKHFFWASLLSFMALPPPN